MRALQLVEIGSPLQLRDVPTAEPGPLDVVVKVAAAGICHSDVHYRRGPRSVDSLPRTLGHEVAGVIEATGSLVHPGRTGERVCLHYQTACTACSRCARGYDQFCESGQMLGRSRDGGYADHITVPSRNAIHLPDEISFEHGAVMMCSSATSMHAVRKARLAGGERVAVFGSGGLGTSAIQIAFAMGAAEVLAVDVDPAKLDLARRLGATPLEGGDGAADRVVAATDGDGVDVSLEMTGLATTMRACVDVLAIGGRAISVGISDQPIQVVPFTELAMREAELSGVSDHHIDDILMLIDMALRGRLNLGQIVEQRVPLDAAAVNGVMDDLESNRSPARTVIVP